jgi:hypothetical protein
VKFKCIQWLSSLRRQLSDVRKANLNCSGVADGFLMSSVPVSMRFITANSVLNFSRSGFSNPEV